MELYLSDHPLDCVSCPANGHCELQDMAEALDITETRYGLKGANHQGLPKDTSNPYFTFDQTMCIACSRCVRACDETQGTFALTIQGRGFASKVSASQNEPFLNSECVSCGACVEACPTVALTENSLITLGAYLPESQFHTPLDYEAFSAMGALVGHGGIVAFDDTVDMSEMARYAMEFCALESCGKCTPCRIGSTRGVEVIDRVVQGVDRDANLALLDDLCDTLLNGSLCGLGGLTPYPVQSALKYFRDDFLKA